MIVITDARGIIRYKSPNIERLFGWKPEALIGKSVLENIHPDDIESTSTFVAKLLENPQIPERHEMRYRCRDGSYLWIEFSAVNLLGDEDIAGILGNYHDITARKEQEQKAGKSRDLLTNLARLVPGVIYQYMLYPDGRSAFPYSSPGMNDIYEVTPEEVQEDASPVFSIRNCPMSESGNRHRFLPYMSKRLSFWWWKTNPDFSR